MANRIKRVKTKFMYKSKCHGSLPIFRHQKGILVRPLKPFYPITRNICQRIRMISFIKRKISFHLHSPSICDSEFELRKPSHFLVSPVHSVTQTDVNLFFSFVSAE